MLRNCGAVLGVLEAILSLVKIEGLSVWGNSSFDTLLFGCGYRSIIL